MKLVFISDTHSMLDRIKVPDGDILLHTGDFTMSGSVHSLRKFEQDMARLPHKHKIVIAGNHDLCMLNEKFKSELKSVTYLEDSSVEIEGLKIYGSPWTPLWDTCAFTLERNSKELADVWAKIPNDTDILLTHGPPFSNLDMTARGLSQGCKALEKRVKEVCPKVHAFGHIHEGYGVKEKEGTTYVNSAICTLAYAPTNEPIVMDIWR